MPIYEYVCKECRHNFELITHAAKKPECPACRSVELEKQLSVFAARTGRGGGERLPEDVPPGACGTCGDPRGPGSCSMN